LTEATRCLLGDERDGDGHAELEPRGEVALKGKSDPVPVHAVVPADARQPVRR
jgi:class 3 adenylate cyclase